MEFKEIWNTLSAINVNEHTDKKGNLTYLSWAWAWAELMKVYPQADYTFKEPVSFPNGSMEVWCTVAIGEHSRTMWLPVIDYKNKAIVNPDSMAINTARMRCLVKCLAMFGLGHYIYAGEDLPEEKPPEASEQQKARFMEYFEAKEALRFYLLTKCVGEEIYIQLYNSFPKDKVKNKKACQELEMEGQAISLEIIETATEQIKAGDVAYKENFEGLEQDEKLILWGMVDQQTKDIAKGLG